jgi:hypothetical protein
MIQMHLVTGSLVLMRLTNLTSHYATVAVAGHLKIVDLVVIGVASLVAIVGYLDVLVNLIAVVATDKAFGLIVAIGFAERTAVMTGAIVLVEIAAVAANPGVGFLQL